MPFMLVQDSWPVTGQQAVLLEVLSTIQFCIPYVVYSWAIRHVLAYRAALIVLLEAVLNPLWTYLAVREAVPAGTLVGGLLILGSVGAWIVMVRRRARQAS